MAKLEVVEKILRMYRLKQMSRRGARAANWGEVDEVERRQEREKLIRNALGNASRELQRMYLVNHLQRRREDEREIHSWACEGRHGAVRSFDKHEQGWLTEAFLLLWGEGGVRKGEA